VAADPAHPSSLIIAFVVPVILLVLFGYGVSLDLERIKVAVVVQEQTPQTQEIASAFANARYFTVQPMADQRKAEALLAQAPSPPWW
jgi:ABC-2 type transport system permease protein